MNKELNTSKDLIKIKIAYCIFIFCLLISCSEKEEPITDMKGGGCKYPVFPHKIIYKDSVIINRIKHYRGIILLDTFKVEYFTNHCSIMESTIKICKKEELSYVEVYRAIDLPPDSIGMLGLLSGKYGNIYVGKVDVAKYGHKWKSKISTYDFIGYKSWQTIPSIYPEEFPLWRKILNGIIELFQ